eukprot:g4727.t1
MGLCGSVEQISQDANGGFTADQCITREDSALTKDRVDLIFFSWSGDDFNVRDGSGSTVFVVKGNALSLRDRVVIADAQGNLIAMMQEKIVSLRKEFQVYSFKPNAEGQESTEKVQDVPVYRFALIQKQLKAITTELCYKLYNGNDVGDTIMIAKAQLAVKLVMKTYKQGDSAKAPLATVGQTKFVQFEAASEYVEMGAGASSASQDKYDLEKCRELLGEDFDESKFAEAKDAEGFVSKEQIAAAAASKASKGKESPTAKMGCRPSTNKYVVSGAVSAERAAAAAINGPLVRNLVDNPVTAAAAKTSLLQGIAATVTPSASAKVQHKAKDVVKKLKAEGWGPGAPVVLFHGFASSGLVIEESTVRKKWVGTRVFMDPGKLGISALVSTGKKTDVKTQELERLLEAMDEDHDGVTTGAEIQAFFNSVPELANDPDVLQLLRELHGKPPEDIMPIFKDASAVQAKMKGVLLKEASESSAQYEGGPDSQESNRAARNGVAYHVIPKDGWKDADGVKVRPDLSNFGLHGVDFLTRGTILPKWLGRMTSYVYQPLIESLQSLGYVAGESFVAATYDWRIPPSKLEERDGFFTRTMDTIETMVAKSKSGRRKVALVGHSMGCRTIVYFTRWVERSPAGKARGGRAWLDANVESIATMGGPFLGAAGSARAKLFGERTHSPADYFLSAQFLMVLFRSLGSLPFLFPTRRWLNGLGARSVFWVRREGVIKIHAIRSELPDVGADEAFKSENPLDGNVIGRKIIHNIAKATHTEDKEGIESQLAVSLKREGLPRQVLRSPSRGGHHPCYDDFFQYPLADGDVHGSGSSGEHGDDDGAAASANNVVLLTLTLRETTGGKGAWTPEFLKPVLAKTTIRLVLDTVAGRPGDYATPTPGVLFKDGTSVRVKPGRWYEIKTLAPDHKSPHTKKKNRGKKPTFLFYDCESQDCERQGQEDDGDGGGGEDEESKKRDGGGEGATTGHGSAVTPAVAEETDGTHYVTSIRLQFIPPESKGVRSSEAFSAKRGVLRDHLGDGIGGPLADAGDAETLAAGGGGSSGTTAPATTTTTTTTTTTASKTEEADEPVLAGWRPVHNDGAVKKKKKKKISFLKSKATVDKVEVAGYVPREMDEICLLDNMIRDYELWQEHYADDPLYGKDNLATAPPPVRRMLNIYGTNLKTEVGSILRRKLKRYDYTDKVESSFEVDKEATLRDQDISRGFICEKGLIFEGPETIQAARLERHESMVGDDDGGDGDGDGGGGGGGGGGEEQKAADSTQH